MYNIKIILLITLLINTSHVYAQEFNTIRYKNKIPEIRLREIKYYKKDTNYLINEKTNNASIKNNLDTANHIKHHQMISYPLKSFIINSPYGYRVDPINKKMKFHAGIDLKSNKDTVMAVSSGTIEKVGYNKKMGMYVIIDHGKHQTIYAHLSNILIKEKQIVQAGEAIGITGSTGRSTGDHLHFEIKIGKKHINPVIYFESVNQLLSSFQ